MRDVEGAGEKCWPLGRENRRERGGRGVKWVVGKRIKEGGKEKAK